MTVKIVKWIVIFVLLSVIGIMSAFHVWSSRRTTPVTNVRQDNFWYTYDNNYYHFKLMLPSDWLIDEFVKEDGQPAFLLSSGDRTVSIESPPPEYRQLVEEGKLLQNYHEKAKYKEKQIIHLGKFPVIRAPYINDFGEIIDRVTLSQPYQKSIVLFFNITGDYDTNNTLLIQILKTFEFTQREQPLDVFIRYQIPASWQAQKFTDAYNTYDKMISLVSPDYSPNEDSSIKSGARIAVKRFLKDPRKDLNETALSILPIPLRMQNEGYEIRNVEIADRKSINLFYCWEGCVDAYFLEDSDYYWRIDFLCEPGCSRSKLLMDASTYGKDRDSLLNSLELKQK